MKILLSSLVLDLSGTPTYTLTLYNELVKRGHDVTVYSPLGGELEKYMQVVNDLGNVQKPDIIIAHMNTCADDMGYMFPDVPLIFTCHGIIPKTETNPCVQVSWYTAINEDVKEHLVNQGVDPSKITIIRNFVDTNMFRPIKPINDSIKNVLFISNYKKWRSYTRVEKSCKSLGLNLKSIGSPYGRSRSVQDDINDSDVVISVGRGIIEGMACGRPVISFDQMRGDGYLTEEMYYESRTRNFFGDKCIHLFEDPRDLTNEILKYNKKDGSVNRDLAVKYHDVVSGVDDLLSIVNLVKNEF